MVESHVVGKIKLLAWCRLLRLPNILTVPGDSLAGLLLATTSFRTEAYPIKSLLLCMAASVCVYCGGLLQNDFCDRKKDLLFRPERPIPSGYVPAAAVIVVAMVLFGLGLFLSWWIVEDLAFKVCILMVSLVVLYNSFTKKIACLGAVNMGLCRGLNFLLGASIIGSAGILANEVLVSAGFYIAYISVLTMMAAHEERPHELGAKRWAIVLVLLGWFISLLIMLDAHWGVYVLSGAILVLAGYHTFKVSNFPEAKKLQNYIGVMIRFIVLIQAVIVSMVEPFLSVILVLVWGVMRPLSKRFYSS